MNPVQRTVARVFGIETRQTSSYTDALVQLLTQQATGRAVLPTATAALEACAGLVGRAFAGTTVETSSEAVRNALTPSCLEMIGRALLRRGEIVLYVSVADGKLKLLPAQSHDVSGGADPQFWTYRLELAGPDRTMTIDSAAAANVVHLTYARDPETPWRGYGPLQVALLAGRLSAELANSLADEASGPVGKLLAVPVQGGDETLNALREQLGGLKGKTALVRGGDWDNPGSGAAADWMPKRLGPEVMAPVVELQRLASEEVYGACGINPALLSARQSAVARESYRQFVHGTIAPLGKLVESELQRKLDDDVKLSWEELRAADITARARAFQSMVGAGMPLEQAAALSGLLGSDDETQ